ncbi:MAG: hypothetical protein GY699_01140 [Desulfobacteraceae bacterium]|nr:hypothetical protein [Desulfobacteraceae bacterium]
MQNYLNLKCLNRELCISDIPFKAVWLCLFVSLIFLIPFETAFAANKISKIVSRSQIQGSSKSLFKNTKKLNITVRCDISSLEKSIIRKNGYDFYQIRHKKFIPFAEQAGHPILPVKTIHVLIPDGYEFDAVKHIDIFSQTQLPVSKLFPKQRVSHSKSPQVQPFVSLKNNDCPVVEYIHTANIRGNRMAVFRFNPVRFHPDKKENAPLGKGTLWVHETVEFDLALKSMTKPIKKRAGKYRKPKSSQALGTYIESMVINPEDMEKEHVSTKALEESSTELCDYLIITSPNLMPEFQVLADHRQDMGLKTTVMSLTDIYNTYPAQSNQEKIKECIKEYAEDKGTLWVLLGGDNTVVPDYDCFASVNQGEYLDSTIPTDLYYAGLDDMDWNDDGDTMACELDNDGDSIDMYPDVFIGRAPVRSRIHALTFVSKVIAYETAVYDPSFHEAALFSGIELWESYAGRSDADWWSESLWKKIHEDQDPVLLPQKYRFYDTGTDFDGGAGYNVSVSHVKDQVSSGYGVMYADTHGGEGVLGVEGENFNTSDVGGCVNQNNQGIFYTAACNTNWFDHSQDPGFSEAFIRSSAGGFVAYIGSSRYGWGYSSKRPDIDDAGPSWGYALEFFKALYYDNNLEEGSENNADPSTFGKRLGAVFASHKLAFVPDSDPAVHCNPERWLQFSLNLMGDPFMKVMVKLLHDSDLDKDIDGMDLGQFILKTNIIVPDLWELAQRFGI